MNKQETTINIKYRTWLNGLAPRRIKLEIPGWAGVSTYEIPQPWHCKPYMDGATYGLEIIYNWDAECIVTCDKEGKSHFVGDFNKEIPAYLGKDWHPFASFAPGHFGYVAMVDIQTEPEMNLFLQPHPRAFTDRTGTVPICMPGMLEMDWWPEIFFMVFKAPIIGQSYIFRKGDPIASAIVVPRHIKYNIEKMTEEEDLQRAERQELLENQWPKICTRVFYCKDGEEFFDNKYKIISNVAMREGVDKAIECLDDPRKLENWGKPPEIKDFRPEGKRPVLHHAPPDPEPKTQKMKPAEKMKPTKPKKRVIGFEVIKKSH